MNKELLNRLDFKNGQLEKWLNECPFPITNFRQMDFETDGQKQVEILVDIPIEQTTVNLDHYGLKLDQKTADLEMQFIKIDKERKALILPRLKELKFRMKQVKNVANRSNYVYTENEAKAIVKFMQEQLDMAADEFLDPLKEFNAQPIQFDTTEYD